MQERRTSSMLQRVPVILAVTAASYGLQLPPHIAARSSSPGISSHAAATQPTARIEPAVGTRRKA